MGVPKLPKHDGGYDKKEGKTRGIIVLTIALRHQLTSRTNWVSAIVYKNRYTKYKTKKHSTAKCLPHLNYVSFLRLTDVSSGIK